MKAAKGRKAVAGKRKKEVVYDRDINPLMARIIKLCKKHGISMFATFSLDDTVEQANIEDGSNLWVTTALSDGAGAIPSIVRECRDRIYSPPVQMMAVTITERHTPKAGGSVG